MKDLTKANEITSSLETPVSGSILTLFSACDSGPTPFNTRQRSFVGNNRQMTHSIVDRDLYNGKKIEKKFTKLHEDKLLKIK